MKVSVIVPVYNAGKYLVKCLDSIINQDYKDIEIILVNDGSTDNSMEIIKDYQKRYKNIILIDQKNHGQGYARNRGLEKSTGDYITFVDSDDYIDKEMISKMISTVDNNDVVVSDIVKVINGKETIFKNYYNYGKDNISFMLSHPGPVAKLYKRSILKDVMFMENVYYEDLVFTTEAALNIRKVKYLEEGLYYYNVHDNSTMQNKKFNDRLDDIFKVMETLESKLSNYEKELEYLFIEHMLYSASLRYVSFKEGKERLKKINEWAKKYPNWKKNPYYNKKSSKFKLVVKLSYHKLYFLLKILVKMKGTR